MLRACRAVLRPGGVMAFTAIQQAPGLGPLGRRVPAQVGPSDVVVRTSYPSLLASAGFTEVVADDVTAQYRATLGGWIEASRRHTDELVAIVGPDEVEERRADRLATLAAIDDGVLQRWMFVARRPQRRLR